MKARECGLACLWIGLFENSDLQGIRKSFVIQHDPNPLFDVLGYLFALAIHDDVFATGLRDIEEVYRIEIPLHMDDIKLEIKGAKLDLPIFHRPARPVNHSRNPMAIGLPRGLCGEANDGVMARDHTSSSQAKEQKCSCSLSAANRNMIRSLSCQGNLCCHHESAVFSRYYLPSATSMASSYVEEDQEGASPEHQANDTFWHRRVEDGIVEYLVPAKVRPLDHQARETLELVKLWREGKREERANSESFPGEEKDSASFGI